MRPYACNGRAKTASAEAEDQGEHGADYAGAKEESDGDDGPQDAFDALDLRVGSV